MRGGQEKRKQFTGCHPFKIGCKFYVGFQISQKKDQDVKKTTGLLLVFQLNSLKPQPI